MYSERTYFRNATLYDGTGAAPFRGSLLVEGDRIAALGELSPPEDAQVINAAGLTLAPGFLDVHSHSDLQVLEGRTEKTLQGVTSEVVGNCGFSPYPMAQHADQVRQFANGILCGNEHWAWPDATSYLRDLAGAPCVNAYSLIGHGSMRVDVAGNEQRALDATEMDRMEGQLDDALSAGALGLSTGLMYAPGSGAPREELERLCSIVARRGKVYATHMRSYSFGLEEAVEEQLELARRTGCRLQISHLQAVGQANWHKQLPVLERIECAVDEGIDVAFDCYPYIAGNTTLTQLVPQWVLDGGTESMIERLSDESVRRSLIGSLAKTLPFRWNDIVLTSVVTPQNQWTVGSTLEQIALERHQDPAETLLDFLVEERGDATILTFNQSEDNLRRVLIHPFSIIITDGLFIAGKVHPRLHGTFPFLLGEISRNRRWLPPAEAIHKVTGKPAERFGIRDRGVLRTGCYADIVVFDAEQIDCAASYEQPSIEPVGIRAVVRNGHFLTDPQSLRVTNGATQQGSVA